MFALIAVAIVQSGWYKHGCQVSIIMSTSKAAEIPLVIPIKFVIAAIDLFIHTSRCLWLFSSNL